MNPEGAGFEWEGNGMGAVNRECIIENMGVGDIIHLIDNKCDRDMKVFFRNRGFSVLEVSFLMVTNNMEAQEISLKKIEEFLQVTQSDVTRISKKLEEKGYIVKYTDPDDFRKRSVIMRLTDKGIKMAKMLERKAENLREIINGKFTEQEIAVLKEMLLRIYDTVRSINPEEDLDE